MVVSGVQRQDKADRDLAERMGLAIAAAWEFCHRITCREPRIEKRHLGMH
jgi:hypothetical protein